jgi:hypothetical protein
MPTRLLIVFAPFWLSPVIITGSISISRSSLITPADSSLTLSLKVRIAMSPESLHRRTGEAADCSFSS